MESKLQDPIPQLTDDGVEEMLALAQRLREQNGGHLDESAIQAVAEATGVEVEYVRLAVKLRAEKEKLSFLAQTKAQFLTLGPDTRRYVLTGLAAVLCALLDVLGQYTNSVTNANGSQYDVFGMISLVFVCGAAYNLSLAREARTASVCGAIFGGGYYMISALGSMICQTHAHYSQFTLIPYALVGALLGLAAYRIMGKYRSRLGLSDPVKDRQEMLRQLVELKERLHSGQQSMTFLSLDIVGSTRMKEQADPLSIEFTFNEYHEFVDRIAKKYGGRVHSTAGDGIICAFEAAPSALGAAKNIQAELIELNTFRNKIGIPIVLRAGIHSGNVVVPDGDVTTVNFAHVIDMAAHIQKECPPGGIAVSEVAALQLPGGMAGVGMGRFTCMEVEAAVWTPRQAPALPQTAKPPAALPEGA